MRSNRPSAAAMGRLARGDPALGAALRRVPAFPGFPLPAHGRMSHVRYLARVILYQQLADAAARTIVGRVVALTPGPQLPSAEELLALPEAALRGAGVSRAKTAALRDLARRAVDGRLGLRAAARLDDAEIVERIVQVRGLGVWSAQMFLLFRLGRLDVMPGTDLGVQEGLRRLDGLPERPAPRQVEQRAEAWAPLRSVAAWVLWRLAEERL